MTLSNPPVATMCIYTITQRDFGRWGQRGHVENFCSWWSLCHRW